MPTVQTEELSRVMREITEAMLATGSALVQYDPDDSDPSVLHVERDVGPTDETIRDVIAQLPLREDQETRWLDYTDGSALILPVQPVVGHCRLLIAVFFDHPTAATRARAQEAYDQRRPFAIDYFRLWQSERTLRRRAASLESALNLNELGVLMLDRAGRLTFANSAARAIVDASDGLRRTSTGIAATQLKDSMRLQVAINHVIAANREGGTVTRRGTILTTDRRNGSPLILSVLPAEVPATEAGDVATIIYVLDPSLDPGQLLQPICKLFQLSPAETKLVCLLASGRTLSEAARNMHTKEQTARSCLKQVFIKTNTNRQADLVRVMLSNIAHTTRSIPADVV